MGIYAKELAARFESGSSFRAKIRIPASQGHSSGGPGHPEVVKKQLPVRDALSPAAEEAGHAGEPHAPRGEPHGA
ncbi:unnamed protein product [Gulo gulo]|uniref:Uncharacterized protein n=1 Tax=Gulo gulo TaxID=48420 RepID=A0A9X9LZ58_GULGU|nr:unnamed protein product [Gulo gulo]